VGIPPQRRQQYINDCDPDPADSAHHEAEDVQDDALVVRVVKMLPRSKSIMLKKIIMIIKKHQHRIVHQ
jgi:hypothetical protein